MSRRDAWLFWSWVAWAAVCTAAMAAVPGEETIPYHLGYAALALATGLATWSRSRSLLALGGFTLLTGIVLVQRAATGVIAWEETAEIPLMCLLMVLVVWHIERRNAALRRVTELATRERDQRARRERLVRVVSHEMRTPLSIAAGYVDLLNHDGAPPEMRADLDVVREELDRVAMAARRLLRLIRLHEDLPLTFVDVDAIVRQTATRWRVVADRRWQVEAGLGRQIANEDRIRACLDTLVENAVRYTGPGDVVRVYGCLRDGVAAIGVADSGPGFSDDHLRALEASTLGAPSAADSATIVPDARSQTGLGLTLVREVLESRGGRLEVGRSREGGADVALLLPVRAGAGWRVAAPPVVPPEPAVLVEGPPSLQVR